jgi:hypothetical protein
VKAAGASIYGKEALQMGRRSMPRSRRPPAIESARTIVRRASSTLKALCCRGTAPRRASAAAER